MGARAAEILNKYDDVADAYKRGEANPGGYLYMHTFKTQEEGVYLRDFLDAALKDRAYAGFRFELSPTLPENMGFAVPSSATHTWFVVIDKA